MRGYRVSKTEKTKIHFGDISETFLARKNQHFVKGIKYHLIVDSGLPESQQARIFEALEQLEADYDFYFLAGSESAKTVESVFGLIRQMLQSGVLRKDKAVICGGGAVLDAGNFAASIILRGISTILVPTTLLSMVDASIGGKTAINIDSIKNQVGTFHNPEAVFIDSRFLETLEPEEMKSGLGEVLKTLFLAGKTRLLKRLCEKGMDVEILKQCVEFKARVVQQDPFERRRKREILNFGHTVAHALEAATAEALKHGCAVAVGMLIEQKIAEKTNSLAVNPAVSQAIKKAIESIGYETETIKEHDIFPFLKFDKKIKESDQVRFIYLEDFGRPKSISLKKEEFEYLYMEVVKNI